MVKQVRSALSKEREGKPMEIIVDRIRLLSEEHRSAFETWVSQTDYAACPDLPSVLQFQVIRADPGAGCDYFEIIQVSSVKSFETDMKTEVFARLVNGFSQMAEVIDSYSGTLVAPGYLREKSGSK